MIFLLLSTILQKNIHRRDFSECQLIISTLIFTFSSSLWKVTVKLSSALGALVLCCCTVCCGQRKQVLQDLFSFFKMGGEYPPVNFLTPTWPIFFLDKRKRKSLFLKEKNIYYVRLDPSKYITLHYAFGFFSQLAIQKYPIKPDLFLKETENVLRYWQQFPILRTFTLEFTWMNSCHFCIIVIDILTVSQRKQLGKIKLFQTALKDTPFDSFRKIGVPLISNVIFKLRTFSF